MNLLAFDTSTDTLSIAVQRGAGAHARTWEHVGPGGAQASAKLIPAILQLMQQAGLEFGDLTAIVYGRGPGSFTGLRTACSVAQGLAFGAGAQGVAVLPVDTLLAVAEEARFQLAANANLADGSAPTLLHVTAMLDARMDEVYVQQYQFDSGVWLSHGDCEAIRPEEIVLDEVVLAQPNAAGVRPISLLAGNVFSVYAGRLPGQGLMGDSETDPVGGAVVRCAALPTATALLRLAPGLLRAGQAVAADQALPLYIRDKVAQTTQERLAAKALTPVLPTVAAPPHTTHTTHTSAKPVTPASP